MSLSPDNKVAIVFFGLTRTLSSTIDSIQSNLLNVLSELKMKYDIFIHTYKINGKYENNWSKESVEEYVNEDIEKILNPKYFIFDSLNADASIGTYGIGFHLLNDADSNIIRKCIISSSLTNTLSGSSAGIAISGADNNAVGLGATLCDANIIRDNSISGGYYGVTLTANFAGGANGNNIIFNNKIIDFYRYGIYVNGSYNTSIEKNNISRPT